jgi:hypothetical protein
MSDAGRASQLDLSPLELRFDHVEGAFNGCKPGVDPIDDAIASEEKGRRHGVVLRSARRRFGTAPWSTSTCSQASREIVAPSSRLRPTRDRATTKFRDATASPGKGFSLAKVNNRVDIFDLRNKLNRIVHIHPKLRGVSRAEAHKRVFRLFGRRETSERGSAFAV